MRRPPGARKTAILAASLLLISYINASQNHEQLYHRKSSHEQGPAEDQFTRSGIPGLRNDAYLETTQYKHIKDTNIVNERKKASAVATKPSALAGDDSQAVRAIQPAQRGPVKSAGLSTPLQARSLHDWEVEDFVLLATVDGSIHARDRKTGAPKWELGVDKPMVETVYHTRNKSELEGSRPEYDYLWIVEPSRDGEIYIYNQGALGGLQKLHLTVKQLVADMSPYESADPAVVYNGEKRTKLYTVDASSGTINKIFGSGGTLSKEPRCPKPGGLDILDDEECGSSGSFVLGRTEYTITIQNRDTTDPICTLRYSEWGPNTRDGDLHSQYSVSMDNKYVYPLHDGSIFGWDHAKVAERQRAYTQKLSSPVVRVFDVARPLQTEDQDPQLVILPQPIGPIDLEALYGSSGARNRIFVNHTEAGGWFAMSENTYPLVAGKAKEAQCYDKDWLAWTSATQCSLDERQEGFVGVHALSDFDPRRGSPLTIGSRAQTPEIEEPPPDAYEEASRLPALSLVGRSRIISGALENVVDTLIVLALALLAYAFFNRQKLSKALNGNLKFRNPLIISEQTSASVPASPSVAQPPWTKETDGMVGANKDEVQDGTDKGAIRLRSRSSTLSAPAPQMSRGRSNSSDLQQSEDIERGVRFQELPEPSVDDENLDPSQSPQPGKKKARRGVRGGARHSKKKRSNSQHESKDQVDQTVKDIMDPPNDPAIVATAVDPSKTVATTAAEMADPDGTLRIGHLTVQTDKLLGHGGHGTVVYKGTFGGRDVAVKRMLREFFDIASHEVGLLQESDDHPNVIRYFDKEEDGQFFYIALELCPASLQDVIERPESYPALDSSSDRPEMLRQITAGLMYLHSLKIVHRDIKPQNILVSSPKVNPLNPSAMQQPRLLISDFGLCKKLEADQNSFRATTAHAAGTSGWRAPELLIDDDPNLKPSATTDTNNSEPLVIDTQTKRSATRAIDIFALGCIFYYCLTNGQHPFDKQDKFMREANIVKGTYNIDALGCLGDTQWEARDLVESMLKHNPKQRPDASKILRHPFFWDTEKRLQFLCDVSDGFEHEKHMLDEWNKVHPDRTDGYSEHLEYLESCTNQVIEPQHHMDFLRALPRDFVDTLGKQRKYKGGSLLDLLRALRNKKNHFNDIPEDVKRRIGRFPEDYLTLWTRRFPNLLLTCWRVIEDVEWTKMDRFRRFYESL
ncbi:MAG: bifunctional endoribonuclease/protein kinase ire1 [Ramalina farinacea]|uniref:non-specific serine/threonine protein kinase n=1 Tax=Ramalina farinacea TaxID=258253 RepID=A0AA43QVE1_9LECA|nr:bifunctional endoribonuclease/protein kinase ire1 [Ramalina farinacea]